jgi:hypothetical protein
MVSSFHCLFWQAFEVGAFCFVLGVGVVVGGVVCLFVFGSTKIEPRAWHMLGKYFTTELHPQP